MSGFHGSFNPIETSKSNQSLPASYLSCLSHLFCFERQLWSVSACTELPCRCCPSSRWTPHSPTTQTTSFRPCQSRTCPGSPYGDRSVSAGAKVCHAILRVYRALLIVSETLCPAPERLTAQGLSGTSTNCFCPHRRRRTDAIRCTP